MDDDLLDVLIVGAGISGIGAAAHLKRLCPDRRWAIVEARDRLGGTWDLFRYPGVRSDSDMHTLGYSFRPWTGDKAIAEGPTILRYLEETAREEGIDRQIRYRHRMKRAEWSSADACWTVEIERPDAAAQVVRTRFLMMCGGYYDYDAGYLPDYPGRERFHGPLVHPQQWSDAIEYVGKRVVVIGSGATAVTLVPALAEKAAHVTMLQRSPTYMVTRPAVDPFETRLRRLLGARAAHAATRWKNVLLGQYFFRLCRARPSRVKKTLIDLVRQQLQPGFDVDTHFTPRYNPWEQRLCLVPDGDFFAAIRAGTVDVVTGEIDTFTETGIRLKDGKTLEADLVVSATGLVMKVMKGVELLVDGHRVTPSESVSYKGAMFAGVPNFVSVFGYTNASWTLKADLVARWVCRILNHMKRTGARVCMPPAVDPAMPKLPWVDFSSGYFQRALDELPRQGPARPWKLNQNYLVDILALRFGRVDDGVMRFA
ncbi:MAG TPA: NAD(P)/FAD-dependent oxidoreductase [Caldimonas sp.]|nr:NAD(P)/FAD-dependent oxidoreductase [Caldimonas sp.]